MDNIVQGFRDQILTAVEQGSTIEIRGSGSKLWYGGKVQGQVLDTTPYSGVLAYEPSELYVTARAGTPLHEIENLLAQYGQMLAFEAPHFGPQATLGGMVAAGLSGPRRAYAGALRDFVLGVTLMNGRGEALRFGGQVIKNVAGYDVSRLMAGALGSLGLLLEVSLKVSPKPFAETTLAFTMSEIDALHQLNLWAGQALPISASSYHVGRLMLRLSGSEAGVRLTKQKMGGEEVQNAGEYWQSLREQTHHFFAPDDQLGLWRLSLPSTAPALKIRAKSLIEWGGAQRWLWTHESAQSLHAIATQAGGYATLFRHGEERALAQMPLAKPLLQIHRQLKAAFDPHDIFNRGRLFDTCPRS